MYRIGRDGFGADAKTLVPDLLFQAHSAPLGLVFYEGQQFPAEYRGDAFVALHGSWNTSKPTGYKIVRVPFKDGRPTGEYENFLTGFWMYGAVRLAWLEDYAAAVIARADLPVPARLTRGIRFDHVSFAYPGTDRLVRQDVSFNIPAGAVVAIVGENGAGKTTLVKLLSKFYEPTSGAIYVDNQPLAPWSFTFTTGS